MIAIQKKLSELLPIESDLIIESIHTDSRAVRKNSIFFCIDGLTVDGHAFISQAIRNGAKVIVHSKEIEKKNDNVIYYYTENTTDLLAHVSNLFYDFPSKKLKVCGITGTVGKTTVASIVFHTCKNIMNMGFIGTHLVEYGDYSHRYQYTTPEHLFLQETLRDMVDKKMDSVCIEVSSHGLSLKRVNGIDFDIAVFTNLFAEHLDFHQTMENYQNAKLSLFTSLSDSAVAVIDHNEPFSKTIIENTKARIFEYGIDTQCDLMARNIELYYDHSTFDLIFQDRVFNLNLPLIGKPNINYVLAAIGVMINFGIEMDRIVKAILTIKPIEGHYEKIPNDHHLNIIIDGGYTPAHYQQLFEFVKQIKHGGRIIAVFGCPGKKEYAKREKIGKLANQYIDYAILTEENSRQEDTEMICQQIQKEITDIPSVIIENRELAIYQAIEAANSGDTILVIGKGNDHYIINEESEYYIGDKEAVNKAIKEIYSSSNDEEYDDEYEDYI